MKKKRLLTMLLIGAMAGTLLAGCGESEEEALNVDSEISAETDTKESAYFEELQEINVYGLSLYGDSGLTEVVDAINAISEDLINVHINYTCMDAATYMEQIGLMMSGGESFDLVMDTLVSPTTFSIMQSQNQLMEISDYLEEYAPETLELMSDYLGATTVDGGIYAVPCYRAYSVSGYIIMRKDVLDELGLTEQAESIESWSDYEEVMLEVQAAQDSLPTELQTTAMIGNNDGSGNIITSAASNVGADEFEDNYGYETLGDSTKIICVDGDGNVVNYLATEDYKNSIERVRKWYEEGLVYKDAATTSEMGSTLMKNGVIFSYTTLAGIGAESEAEAATGYDVVCVKFSDILTKTYTVNAWGWSVPVTSQNPEAAIAFLNLMYTNEEIANLFVYGIEGRDYELNENGEAVALDSREYQSSDFCYGNQFLVYPTEGTGGDFREVALEAESEAELSPYYGLVVGTDEISNEVTALTNVLLEYQPGLESGSVDSSTLDEMLKALESAGLQKVLDYYQTAVDEWAAEQ